MKRRPLDLTALPPARSHLGPLLVRLTAAMERNRSIFGRPGLGWSAARWQLAQLVSPPPVRWRFAGEPFDLDLDPPPWGRLPPAPSGGSPVKGSGGWGGPPTRPALEPPPQRPGSGRGSAEGMKGSR